LTVPGIKSRLPRAVLRSAAMSRLVAQPGGTATQLPNEVLKLIIGNIGAAPRGNIRPALTGRLLEGLELGFPNALALLDEAQSFTQYLARVLATTGPHEGLYQRPLMFAQNYVARRHVVGSESARTDSLDGDAVDGNSECKAPHSDPTAPLTPPPPPPSPPSSPAPSH